MFKTIQIIVMAMLCLNFSAIAQNNKAIDVTSKGIQIGQMVPDITITNLHNYKDKNGKPATTAKLSDFKGKLLILLIAIRTALHNSSIQQLPIEEELMDNSDAMRLLKISDKTLYLWRKDKLINARMIGRKHYYVKAE